MTNTPAPCQAPGRTHCCACRPSYCQAEALRQVRASVCTGEAGQAVPSLDAIWSARDEARTMVDRLHALLRLELERLPNADRARNLLGRLWSWSDLVDNTTDRALIDLLTRAANGERLPPDAAAELMPEPGYKPC